MRFLASSSRVVVFRLFLSCEALGSATSRRDFLSPSLFSWTVSPLLLVTTDSTTSAPFVYSDTWTGTTLPWRSITEATLVTTVWPMAQWPDPILRRPADPVEPCRFGTVELQRACDLLQKTARQNGAAGLAAQQCGVNARIIVLLNDSFFKSLIMINPRIVERSSEQEMRVWKEHCLVLPPTFVATVLRDAWVTVEYQDTTATVHSITLRGEVARAAQHELDHDRGILVTDHVGLEELENTVMQFIETPGHEDRMALAFTRQTEQSALA